MIDGKLGHQIIQNGIMVALAAIRSFQYGADILLDSEATENTGFLRQISKSQTCPLENRHVGHVCTI